MPTVWLYYGVYTPTGIGCILTAFYKVSAHCVYASPRELVKCKFLSPTPTVGLRMGSAFY